MRAVLLRAAMLACALGLGAAMTMAQKRNANVLSGRNWLAFNDGQPPVADSIVRLGLSSISDTTGQLKVYLGKYPGFQTWHLFDGDHNELPGTPVNLSLSQGGGSKAVFIPKPNAPDSAYMAFINGYTTFPPHMHRLGVLALDIGAQGAPSGGVQPSTNWLATDVAASFMAVPHANEQDYWIVLQPIGSNEFHAYQVSENGISPSPVISDAGPVRSIDWQFGQWVPNAAGDRFAYTQRKSNSAGGNVPDTLETEVFAFDISNGLVSHQLTLPSRRAQGIEFSVSGRFLYIIEHAPNWGQPGVNLTLVQYDMDEADAAATRTVLHTYAEPNYVNGNVRQQLLRGTDGRIYRSHELAVPMLGVIMEPELSAPQCNYVHDGLATLKTFSEFYPPMRRYHDSPVIITAAPATSAEYSAVTSPNPISNTGWLVQTGLEGSVRLEWQDGLGRIVRSEAAVASDGRVAIDASSLSSGSYLLRVSGAGARLPLVQRVVVAP
ncbi:MAG: hypothetical protein IPM12_06510 [Flavobacteriales bacterium]|nr:hypothetical protein [Flavobacteriales bacterium]